MPGMPQPPQQAQHRAAGSSQIMSDDPGWGEPPAGEQGQGGSGFGWPAPGYPGEGEWAPGYSQPPPGYGQPPPGYGQPPPAYGQPSPGYGQPPPGYGQPPPGYGPPPYGTPGYGPWAAQPPAPAPGGVPLRPLAVGDILSGAFMLVRRNPAATLGIAAIVQTIYGISGAFIAWGELNAARKLQTTIILQPNSAQAASHAFGQFFSSVVPYILLSYGLIFVFETILTGL